LYQISRKGKPIFVAIWKGWGILVALIPVVVMLLISQWKELDASRFGLELGFLICAALLWVIGSKLNKRPHVAFFDSDKSPDGFKSQHTFFFIPMQWYGVAFLIITLLTTLIKLT
jgi:hypothetical protein